MTEPHNLKRLTLALRRRRTVVIVTFAGTLALGGMIVLALPSQYRAEATIKVIDARPPADYVQPSFATPPTAELVGERMKALRLHILNRPLVAAVARDTGLLAEFGGDEHRALEALRDRFEFRVEGSDTFTVAFSDPHAERARAVVNQLAERFMAGENAEVEGRADGTTRLLETSAGELRARMSQADLKLADFKRKHYGALPEQQEESLRNLDQTQMEVDILETTLQAAFDRRRHMLEGDVSPLRKAEDELSARLSTARSTYTNDHPEVQRLEAEYSHLRATRITDEQALRSETIAHNPEVLAVGTEIARLQSRMGELRRKQTILRARVGEIAHNQQLLATLSLDRDVLKDKYTQTEGKLREAEMAGRLARDFRPFRFGLIEPAIAPAHPAAPNRPLLALVALGLAAILSLGVATGLELFDPSVRDTVDVEELLPDVPVLAVIPRVDRRKP